MFYFHYILQLHVNSFLYIKYQYFIMLFNAAMSKTYDIKSDNGKFAILNNHDNLLILLCKHLIDFKA